MSSRGRLAIAIYVLAVASRLFVVAREHLWRHDRPEPLQVALAIVRTGEFADPYAIPTGPTAHLAPVQPFLLAPIYALWGDNTKADKIRMGLSILESAAQYALLPYVSSALGLGLLPGVLAGFGGAVFPLHVRPEAEGVFEAVHVALFLQLSTILFARFLSRPSFTWRTAVAGGVWWGLGLLLSPNLVTVLVAFVLIAVWKLRLTAQLLRWTASAAAITILVILPWLVRNRVQLGAWFFIRDNFGLELFVSNRDGATPELATNIETPDWHKVHPHKSVEAARDVLRHGEVGFNRVKLVEAREWIAAHPSEFAYLTLGRLHFILFPLATEHRRIANAVTIVGLTGIAVMLFRCRPAGVILGAMLVTFPAIYLIIEVALRYVHPVWWVLLLGVGWLLTFVTYRWRPRVTL